MPDEERPIEWQHQEAIIRDLLDGHLTTKAAAPKLAAVTLPDPIPDIDNEDDEEEILVNLERMFNMMLRALETGPECVHTIFDLMICMSQLPPALTESGQQLCATDPVRRVWKDLPHLGRSLGAEWSGKSIHIVRKDRSPDKVASRQANSTNPLRISKRVDRTPDALRRKAV